MNELTWVENLEKSLVAKSSSGLTLSLKKKAFEAFQAQGLPRLKDEMWKYTNPMSFIKQAEPLQTLFQPAAIDVEGLEAHHISIIDGQIDQNALSKINENGLEVRLVKGDESLVTPHVDSLIQHGDGFQRLALSASQEVLLVKVEKAQSIAKPIVLHFVSTGKVNRAGMLAPICFIEVGDFSSLQVIEYTYSLAPAAAWSQPITSYRMGASSKLQLLKMISATDSAQLLSYTHIYQQRDAHAGVLSIMSAGKTLRNILNIEQDGPGAFCKANGLSLVKIGEHFDVRSRFLHMKPNGTGQQLYKSVVSEKARFVFNGKIYIAPDAQKVDAQMLNKNLLLGRMAEADTKPELEVYADDVKAGHGASIGQLDVSELFYLMSRGISKRRSLELLARAYVDELVLDLASEEVRNWVNLKLATQLETISRQIEATIDAKDKV